MTVHLNDTSPSPTSYEPIQLSHPERDSSCLDHSPLLLLLPKGSIARKPRVVLPAACSAVELEGLFPKACYIPCGESRVGWEVGGNLCICVAGTVARDAGEKESLSCMERERWASEKGDERLKVNGERGSQRTESHDA